MNAAFQRFFPFFLDLIGLFEVRFKLPTQVLIQEPPARAQEAWIPGDESGD